MRLLNILLCFGILLVMSCNDTDLGVGSSLDSENLKGLPKQMILTAQGKNLKSYSFGYDENTQRLISLSYNHENSKTDYLLSYNANGRLSALNSSDHSVELTYQGEQLLRTERVQGDSSWVGTYSYDQTGHLVSFRYAKSLKNETTSQTLYSFNYSWQGNNLYQLVQRGASVQYDELSFEISTQPNLDATLR